MSGIFILAPSHHWRPGAVAMRRRKRPMTAATVPMSMIQKFAVQNPLNCEQQAGDGGKLLAGLGEQAGELRDEDEREDRHEQDAGADHERGIDHGLDEAALQVVHLRHALGHALKHAGQRAGGFAGGDERGVEIVEARRGLAERRGERLAVAEADGERSAWRDGSSGPAASRPSPLSACWTGSPASSRSASSSVKKMSLPRLSRGGGPSACDIGLGGRRPLRRLRAGERCWASSLAVGIAAAGRVEGAGDLARRRQPGPGRKSAAWGRGERTTSMTVIARGHGDDFFERGFAGDDLLPAVFAHRDHALFDGPWRGGRRPGRGRR